MGENNFRVSEEVKEMQVFDTEGRREGQNTKV